MVSEFWRKAFDEVADTCIVWTYIGDMDLVEVSGITVGIPYNSKK